MIRLILLLPGSLCVCAYVFFSRLRLNTVPHCLLNLLSMSNTFDSMKRRVTRHLYSQSDQSCTRYTVRTYPLKRRPAKRIVESHQLDPQVTICNVHWCDIYFKRSKISKCIQKSKNIGTDFLQDILTHIRKRSIAHEVV